MQLQARRRAQASITNSPSSSLAITQRDVRLAIVTAWRAHAAARAPGTHPGPGRATYSCPRERLPRAEPQSGGSPDPIPNSAVKPRLAESTAAPGRGRTGRSARRGRFFSFARRFLANKRCQMTSLFLFRMGAGKAHGRSRSFFRGIWRISMGWRAGALRWSFAVRAKAGLPPTVRQGPSASVLGIGAYNAQWKRVDGHGERTREDWFP